MPTKLSLQQGSPNTIRHEIVKFSYDITNYSRIVIYERSLDDLLAYDKKYCYDQARKVKEKLQYRASCSRVWPIIRNNDNDIAIEFFSSEENALPMLYNSKTKTYEKIKQLPMLSHLTVLFWCNSRLNFEYIWTKGQSRRNVRAFFTTSFCLKEPAILSEIDLSLWRFGIQNQEAFKLSPNHGPDCWLRTKTFYHVRIPGEPLSLKQLCYTVVLSHSLKDFEGKEKIDLTDILSGETIPKSIVAPRFFEIILLTDPLKCTNLENFW
jgi:hypothetical protein